MGRASRQSNASAAPRQHWSETHPDRHLWTEAQRVHARMQTQEEYEALYGRGPAVDALHPPASEDHREPLFPPGIEIPDLMTTDDRLAIIAEMNVPEGTTSEDFLRDPFVEDLWQAELRRIQREAEEYENVLPTMGVRHWIRSFEDNDQAMEALARTWKENILPRHVTQAEDGTWTGPAVASLEPSSILAAARECQEVPFNDADLSRQMYILRQNSEQEHKKFLEASILPEFAYLARPQTGGRIPDFVNPGLANELWKSVEHLAAVEEDNVDGAFGQEHLRQSLWRGSNPVLDYSDLFVDRPIAVQDSAWRKIIQAQHPGFQYQPDLKQEAITRMEPDALLADPQAEVERVQRTMITDQLMRVGCGLERDVSVDSGRYTAGDVEHDMQQEWNFWDTDSPLEHFRPLFRGEQEEELLDHLVHRFRDCHDRQVYSLLREELLRSVRPPSEESFSQQIHDALIRVKKRL